MRPRSRHAQHRHRSWSSISGEGCLRPSGRIGGCGRGQNVVQLLPSGYMAKSRMVPGRQRPGHVGPRCFCRDAELMDGPVVVASQRLCGHVEATPGEWCLAPVGCYVNRLWLPLQVQLHHCAAIDPDTLQMDISWQPCLSCRASVCLGVARRVASM